MMNINLIKQILFDYNLDYFVLPQVSTNISIGLKMPLGSAINKLVNQIAGCKLEGAILLISKKHTYLFLSPANHKSEVHNSRLKIISHNYRNHFEYIETIISDKKIGIEKHAIHFRFPYKNYSLYTIESYIEIEKPLSYVINIEGDKQKIISLQNEIKQGEALLINQLDYICWLLNIRDLATEYNLLHISYLLVTQDRIILFSENNMILNQIEVLSFSQINNVLSSYQFLLGDYNYLDKGILENFPIKDRSIDFRKQHSKSSSEVRNMIQAQLDDSIAFLKLLYWLEIEIELEKTSEYDVILQLEKIRKTNPRYIRESFSSIVGYGKNSSILHYTPTLNNHLLLGRNDVILLDLGGQYYYGTTDATRTIHLGRPSEEHKHAYTKILQGHLQLHGKLESNQVNILAKKVLDTISPFLCSHAIGHGVGYMLSVHEPNLVISEFSQQTLQENMIITNEPGTYAQFGIRIENTQLVTKEKDNLKMEQLTLLPYANNLILWDQLSDEEYQKISLYYKKIAEITSHYLTEKEYCWLQEKLRLC
jgi:Xaa-Pro aminopeptidase